MMNEQRAELRAIASVLDSAFNGEKKGDEREWGFVVILFPFAGGDVRMISNGTRQEVLDILTGQLKHEGEEGGRRALD